MKKVFLSFLLSAINICCHAFYPIVNNYDKSVYRAGGQNWCITQSENGIMWFANTGLMEYDGNEWKTSMARNMTSIRSLLYDDEEDKIYMGASNELGYIHQGENGMREYVQMLDDKGLSTGEIWAIHKFNGKIWFRDNTTLYQYDSDEVIQHEFRDKITCSSVIGKTLYLSVNGEGVMRISGGRKIEKIKAADHLKDKKICAILDTEIYGIVLVTSRHGIYTLNGEVLTKLEKEEFSALADENIFCAASDERHISFGTVSNGVYIYDIVDKSVMHLNTSSGLQNNTVLSMFYDICGNLWLGLDKGIDLVLLSSPERSLFGDPDNFGTGYASAKHDGKIWLGTNQGLFTMETDNADIQGSDAAIRQFKDIEGQVWDLVEHDGSLFCCHDNGIYIIKGNGYRHIPLNGVWKLEHLRGHPEYLLGSTYDRMFLLCKKNGKWSFSSWIEGFEEASKTFEEDSDGKIWFYHWIKGLFLLSLDLNESRVDEIAYYSKGNGLPEDWGNVPLELNGEIVFSTTDGLYRHDRYSGKMSPMNRLNSQLGHPKGSAHVYASEYGQFYVSNGERQGISYQAQDGERILDTLSLRHLADKRPIGFENINSISENSMMINTEDGFSIIRIDKIGASDETDPVGVFIKDIYSRTSSSEVHAYTSWSRKEDKTVLKFAYTSNTLRFKVAYPKFENRNSARFSFLLEDYDEDWSAWSDNYIKEYTRLPHGRYTLKVKAMDNFSGQESEDSIEVQIEAPWYLSLYAYLLYVVAGAILCALAAKALQMISIKRAGKIAMQKEEEMRHKQMKLNLERKANDLAESTMNLIRKNEILLEIDSNLEKIADYIVEDRNKSLKLLGKIRKDIKENIQHDNVWHKFEENFDVVYADYLKRLSRQYPNLTLADKKMCAYLKMDLTSKEIAPLLNITVRSVEMTRYRLRKKLGLGHEDNLTEFLQNF